MLLTQTIKQPRNLTSMRTARLLAFTLLTGIPLMTMHGTAMAQAYPEQPVKLVVPFPAGGTTDVLARALGQQLAEKIGQPVIIENKPGAGATIGAEYVARSKPDGYTLLMGAVHHTIATTFYSSLRYDFQKDFAPVTTVAMVPNVLVVNNKVGVKSVADLIALAKREPGKLSFGSNGVGTGQHLIGERVQLMSGVKLLHVPYKGSGPLTTDLLGGQVDMSFDTITTVLPYIKENKLTALAVTTGTRSPALPDVPTLDEAGLKGFDAGTWFGILAPKGTPEQTVSYLNQNLVQIIQSDGFKKDMANIGAETIGDTPAQMGMRIADDTSRYAELVNKLNLKAN
ncbi:putative Bug-like extracytoplasmic solute binding receptor, TTT family [Advenella mimigardefordensis DPN7]|uniref:Putative Bug-like extracytoplasmic solute binding receptor, TTT family n=2 Tax=Advenella mimigardefordensis TaxID=302406 RepID=W0PA36_ADVMD|nr:putative Bug-like extracytoplasmic solute binding receptor, TTT family [Advenella mimigardefordensis DPN7]